jgi:hypothetical protein
MSERFKGGNALMKAEPPQPKRILGFGEAPPPTAPVPHPAPVLDTPQVPDIVEVPRTAQVSDTVQVSDTAGTPEPIPEVSDTAPVPHPAQVRGHWTITNDITDTLWPVIRDPYAQSVLVQLLRLSWGFHKDECVVGLQKLADRCGFHKNQARKGRGILVGLGLIAEAGEDNTNPTKELRGTRYKILLKPPPTVKVSGTAPVPNKERLSKNSLKVVVCDLCKDMKGMVYGDPDNPSLGVKRCDHRTGK